MKKHLFVLIALFWLGLLMAQATTAATLTQQQLTTLKQEILVDPSLVVLVNSGQYQMVADALNLPASPTWIVWRTQVSMVEIGRAINGAELGGLTTANHTRLQTIVQISGGWINPTLADQRAFFDDVFSGAGGAITRSNLAALWKRSATRAEKVLSTGTGSTGSPASLGFEGFLNQSDIERILVNG